MMISCKEAAELAQRELDETLPFRTRLALRFHVLMCSLCRTFIRQLAAIRRLSRIAGESGPTSVVAGGRGIQDTLTPSAKARMKDAISGKD